MLGFFDKNNWKTLYEDDYLQKFECFQNSLEKSDPAETEYWFVLTISSLFNVLRQYFVSRDLMYFKVPDIIKQALNDKIIQNELMWFDAYKLTTRIGRAVRPKEENIAKIKEFSQLFNDFNETIKEFTETV